MKRIVKLSIGLLLLTMLFAVVSCDLFLAPETQSKDEVLQAYFSDLAAGNYDNMYTHIHPNNPYRSQLRDGTTFSTIYDGYSGYSVTSSSGDSYSVSVNYGIYQSPETFTFQEDGDDYWLILSFTVGGESL